MTNAPAIVVRNVSRYFGDTHALVDVDLEVETGEIRALLGPNGAGKTTLLRTIVGSVRPSAGEIEVLGVAWRDLANRHSRNMFGLVTSGDRSCYHRLSGLENLLFFGRLQGLSKSRALTRARETLELVGLTDAARKRAGSYSHGMQKRLAIARALLMEPPILLVDEATHDLDPAGAREVRSLLSKAARGGAAVLWATQRVDEIQDTAATVTVLNHGRVQFSGTVDALAEAARSRRYRIEIAGEIPTTGDTNGLTERLQPLGRTGLYSFDLPLSVSLGRAIATLEELGVEVTACRLERPQLEDAFLALTEETHG